MSCLQSFSFLASGDEQYAFPELNADGIATDLNWKYSSQNPSSTFRVQGFKNINVYKIEAVGHIFSKQNTEVSIVSDWAFYVQINGVNSPAIGSVLTSPNGFSIGVQGSNPVIALSRYQTSVEFSTPIESVDSIELIKLVAQGVGADLNASFELNIAWHMNFIVHYTFQGEDFAFL